MIRQRKIKTIKRGFNLVLAAILLVVTCIVTPQQSTMASSNNIIINQGTSNEYTIHSDDTGVLEALPTGFVQNNAKKSSFSKNSLKSTGLPIGNSIRAVYPMSDGTYIGVLNINNLWSPSQTGSSEKVTTYVVKMDQSGNILSSKNIVSMQSGLNVDTSQSSASLGEYNLFAESFLKGTDSIAIIGHAQSATDRTRVNRIFTIDKDLNITQSIIDVNGYTVQQMVLYLTKSNGKMYHHGYFSDSSANKTSFDVYEIANDGRYNSHIQLEAPVYTTMSSQQPSDWILALKQHNSFEKTSTGYIGVVEASSNSGAGTPVRKIFMWDNSGNIVKSFDASSVTKQDELNDNNNYYFTDSSSSGVALKKIDINTGTMTVIKNFPVGTNIKIIPDVDVINNTAYSFYGYIQSTTGEFAGYGSTGGAISGVMNEDFSIENANIISANGLVNINTFQKITGTDLYFVGGSTLATGFSEEPLGGWVDQNTHSSNNKGNSFHGTLKKGTDYAPAMKLDSEKVINLDTTTDLNGDLISDVVVGDSYDLDPNGGNQTMADLRARINYNPNSSAQVSWSDLGLDATKVGANRVTYFVTDSIGQQTVTSRIVNLIKNSTVIDSTNTLAIDASNFTMNLSDASSLTQALINDNAHAKVSAWNMDSGIDLTSGVVADTAQLNAIKNAKEASAFPLKLSVTENGITVEKTIIVFLTDRNTVVDVNNNVVLYGNNFIVPLIVAPSFTSSQGIIASEVKAYDYTTGAILPSSNISIDVTNINRATTVGTVVVPCTYTGNAVTATTVIASIVNEETEINQTNKEIIYATSFSINLKDVESLNATSIKDKAGLIAWDIDTGVAVNNDTIQIKGEVKKAIGPNIVTFITEKGTEKSICISVVSDNTIIDLDKNVAIDASDFTINQGLVSTLTSDKVIELAGATGWDLKTGEILTLDVTYSSIKDASGTYPVLFKTRNVECQIKATVVGNVTIDKNVTAIVDTGDVMSINGYTITLLLGAVGILFGIRKKKVITVE